MIGSVARTAIDKLTGRVGREPATGENPTMDGDRHAEQAVKWN